MRSTKSLVVVVLVAVTTLVGGSLAFAVPRLPVVGSDDEPEVLEVQVKETLVVDTDPESGDALVVDADAELGDALVVDADADADSESGAGPVVELGSDPTDGRAGPPEDLLDRPMRGIDALDRLGDRLQDLAAINGWTRARLVLELRRDPNIWVDEQGRLFYVDEGLTGEAVDDADHAGHAGQGPADPGTVESVHDDVPLSETFRLHSLPGAQRVVYLDFDGHDAADTAWDRDDATPTTAQPYDTDGNPTSFSDSERLVIQQVWKRVAEDFAPFAVDVTTEDPGIDALRRSDSADERYGTRVVVTPTYTYPCGCGGVAYLGTFDISGQLGDGRWRHDLYQPAWVFIAGTNAKSIAEAASHEAGHNLGLAHDGTDTTGYYRGHGDWAPIMGVGYYEAVTQWSQGEYAGATNPEDDLVVAASNGAPIRTDDHGDVSSPTDLSDATLPQLGVIAQRSDVDAFRFATTGGSLDVRVDPTSPGANLDVELRLLDGSGAVIEVSDPPGLAASIRADLAAGTYLLTVDGVGVGDPATTGYSDYGSLGHYRLSGTLPPSDGGDGGGGGDGGDQNRAPVAVIDASITSGPAPLSVAFDGTRSTDPDGDALTTSWTFGDGGGSNEASVTHTFIEPGTYEVSLEVSDGQLGDAAAVTIVVTDPDGDGDGGDGGGGGPQPPAAPTGVTASVDGSGRVTITWTDNAVDEVRFTVTELTLNRRGAVRRSTVVGSPGADSTAFTYAPDWGTYRYEVVAVGDGVASAAASSDPVTVARAKRGNIR